MATDVAVMAYQKPVIIDKWLHVTQDGYAGVIRYHSRGGMSPKIIVIHVQEGSNRGSWQHFHVVKASSTVLIGKNGEVWRLVPEEFAPWTNGDVQSPDDLMRSVLNRYGWDPNTYSLTIEFEGFTGGLPYTKAQLNAGCWQVVTWAKKYAISDVFVVRHGQINSVTRLRCPEGAPYTFTNQLKAAVRGEIPAQVIDVPHQVVRDPWPVVLPDGRRWDGTQDVVINNARFEADRREVTVTVDVLNARQWASTASNRTPHTRTKGQKIKALGWVVGEEIEGERRWWVDELGNRYWAGGIAETPIKDAPVIVAPSDPEDQPDYGNLRDFIPVISNGTVYYPFQRKGEARFRTFTVVDGPANLRQWANTASAITGSVAQGSVVKLSHYCVGEELERADGGRESLWGVIDDGSRQPVYSAPRIWMGLLDERPD